MRAEKQLLSALMCRHGLAIGDDESKVQLVVVKAAQPTRLLDLIYRLTDGALDFLQWVPRAVKVITALHIIQKQVEKNLAIRVSQYETALYRGYLRHEFFTDILEVRYVSVVRKNPPSELKRMGVDEA
jgi:hypothetical protein